MTSSLEKTILGIMDSYFWLDFDGFVFYKHEVLYFTRCYLTDWSRVDYCDAFISGLDFHSDGTHSLHSTGGQVMQC